MPTDERSTKSVDRCHAHPGESAIAGCQRCGRPICLTCAVPVRGEVLGAECLPDDMRAYAEPPPPTAHRTALAAAGAAFCVGLLASAFPWVQRGPWFGAWPRPSASVPVAASIAGIACLVGALSWLIGRAGSRRGTAIAMAWIGAVTAVSSWLAFRSPPALSHASPAPLATAVAGALALILAATAARVRRA